jgi:oligopeptide transport system substrate-binding protein
MMQNLDSIACTRTDHSCGRKCSSAFCLLLSAFCLLASAGCSNNPYPAGETAKPILYGFLGDDPKTLDPSIAYDVAAAEVVDPIYPAYLQYHYLKRDPFVLEPGLGAEQPRRAPYTYSTTEKGKQVAHTGESWIFRIKKGLRFQDDPCFPGGKGREITAADFLYSFRRMADPSITCPIVSYFDDKILGMADYETHNRERIKRNQSVDYHFPMEGLQLDPKDPYAFRVLLNQPYPQLRYLMAMHFTSPLAHEAAERYGKELARHPVGCGAFLLAEYKPKGRIVLRANPNYREETYPSEGMPGDREAGLLKFAGQRLPLVKEVQFGIIHEGVTAWNLFLQGYMDSAGVSQENYQQALSHPGELSEEMKRRGIALHRAVAIDIGYFAFNMNDPIYGGYTPQRRKLRQAISTAIDSQAFIDLLSLGLGKPAQSIISPGLFGYDPDYTNPYRQPDIERAKQLLAEAGYPGGIDSKTGERLTLYYDNYATTPAGRQEVALVTKQIEALGIHFESRAWRYPVFQDKVDKGQFQFMSYGWVADYPDPENFVFLLYGPNKRPGPNASAYHNPEYDRLFEQMRAMDDGPQRLELIRRMRAIAVEDCPWIYHIHGEGFGLTQAWFPNFKPHPVAMDTVKYYAIDGPRRARLQAEWNRPNYWPALGALIFLIVGSLPAASVVRQRTQRHVRRNREGKP